MASSKASSKASSMASSDPKQTTLLRPGIFKVETSVDHNTTILSIISDGNGAALAKLVAESKEKDESKKTTVTHHSLTAVTPRDKVARDPEDDAPKKKSNPVVARGVIPLSQDLVFDTLFDLMEIMRFVPRRGIPLQVSRNSGIQVSPHVDFDVKLMVPIDSTVQFNWQSVLTGNKCGGTQIMYAHNFDENELATISEFIATTFCELFTRKDTNELWNPKDIMVVSMASNYGDIFFETSDEDTVKKQDYVHDALQNVVHPNTEKLAFGMDRTTVKAKKSSWFIIRKRIGSDVVDDLVKTVDVTVDHSKDCYSDGLAGSAIFISSDENTAFNAVLQTKLEDIINGHKGFRGSFGLDLKDMLRHVVRTNMAVRDSPIEDLICDKPTGYRIPFSSKPMKCPQCMLARSVPDTDDGCIQCDDVFCTHGYGTMPPLHKRTIPGTAISYNVGTEKFEILHYLTSVFRENTNGNYTLASGVLAFSLCTIIPITETLDAKESKINATFPNCEGYIQNAPKKTTDKAKHVKPQKSKEEKEESKLIYTKLEPCRHRDLYLFIQLCMARIIRNFMITTKQQEFMFSKPKAKPFLIYSKLDSQVKFLVQFSQFVISKCGVIANWPNVSDLDDLDSVDPRCDPSVDHRATGKETWGVFLRYICKSIFLVRLGTKTQPLSKIMGINFGDICFERTSEGYVAHDQDNFDRIYGTGMFSEFTNSLCNNSESAPEFGFVIQRVSKLDRDNSPKTILLGISRDKIHNNKEIQPSQDNPWFCCPLKMRQYSKNICAELSQPSGGSTEALIDMCAHSVNFTSRQTIYVYPPGIDKKLRFAWKCSWCMKRHNGGLPNQIPVEITKFEPREKDLMIVNSVFLGNDSSVLGKRPKK